jgi:predicted nuclease of predicted toxin-antitoxin system
VQALRDDGHDVARVVDVADLGEGATDEEVLAAAVRADRVLLAADQSDFSDPSTDDHPGVVVIADATRSGGELRRAVRRLDETVHDLSNHVAYVSDWL